MTLQTQHQTAGTDSIDICIPNISTPERRKRLLGGLVSLAIGMAVLAALMFTGADRWWRLALFPLLVGATEGFFQWRDKT
jgi:hypothetical protein